jgi:chemotaxis protein histidine kinase CheA
MSSSVGVLDFFIVEASEYLDRLDSLLTGAGSAGPGGTGTPDLDAIGRAARALRGSAIMARRQGIADVAAGIERVVRALKTGSLRWDHSVSAPLVGAVDDLRIVVRNARAWSPADDSRTQARAAELDRLAPAAPGGQRGTPRIGTMSGSAFLSSETADLARVLDQFVASATPAALVPVIERVRALRGVADVRDMPPLPDVMEGVENALKSLELTTAAAISEKQRALFTAASAVLRRAARDIAARGRPDPDLPELASFNTALAAVADESGRGDRIVPVTQLFYDDAGPHIVSTAPHPPTTAAERFRMEVVSLAEHLRRIVAQARSNPAPEHRERIGRELRNGLRALGAAANSFGEKSVAHFAAQWSVGVTPVDASALVAIDTAAALLADPATTPADLARGLDRLSAPRTTRTASRPTPAIRPDQAPPAPGAAPASRPAPGATIAPAVAAQSTGPGASPNASGASPAAHTPFAPAGAAEVPTAPASTPSPAEQPRERIRTPTGRDLHAFLQDGLAGFRELEDRPLSPPVPLPDETIVPIEELLYRGRGALQRAAELREELLQQGATPSREAVQELFDLIDLALVD